VLAWGPFLTKPLAPRDEVCPLGWMFPLSSPPPAPLVVNTLYCLEEWRGKHRISPPWYNFTPRGQSSLLGDKFAPGGSKFAHRGEVKNGPLAHFSSTKNVQTK
jgi:hypothetical protein